MKRIILSLMLVCMASVSFAQETYTGTVKTDVAGSLYIGNTLIKANDAHLYYEYGTDGGNKVRYESYEGLSHYTDTEGYIVPNEITRIASGAFGSNINKIFFPDGWNGTIEPNAFEGNPTFYFGRTIVGETMGAKAVEMEEPEKPADNRIYNIQGMEINEPQDGEIFIQNGTKYIKVRE